MCGLLDRFSRSYFDLLDVLKTHCKVSPDFDLDMEDRQRLRLLLVLVIMKTVFLASNYRVLLRLPP